MGTLALVFKKAHWGCRLETGLGGRQDLRLKFLGWAGGVGTSGAGVGRWGGEWGPWAVLV